MYCGKWSTEVGSPNLSPRVNPVGIPSSSSGLFGSRATVVSQKICLSLFRALNSSNLIHGLRESQTGML